MAATRARAEEENTLSKYTTKEAGFYPRACHCSVAENVRKRKEKGKKGGKREN
jgi:hypothetical protein